MKRQHKMTNGLLFIWFTPGEYIIKWQLKRRNNWSKFMCNEHVPNIANSRKIVGNMIPKISMTKFLFQWTIKMIAKVSFFYISNEIPFRLIYKWWFITLERQSKNANQLFKLINYTIWFVAEKIVRKNEIFLIDFITQILFINWKLKQRNHIMQPGYSLNGDLLWSMQPSGIAKLFVLKILCTAGRPFSRSLNFVELFILK